MSNKNLSLLFTGQGSQYPEMGLDLINEYKWVKDRYSISSDILGYNVLDAQNNPNLLNLPLTGNTILQCKQGNTNCGLTTACDVPGPTKVLCLNPKVTLYNYKVRRTYKAGGTKWPYYFNKDYPYNQKYGY